MAVYQLNVLGLKCPNPLLKVSAKSSEMAPGDILEVEGDCSTLEKDLRLWSTRMKKTILSVKDEEADKKKIQIQF